MNRRTWVASALVMPLAAVIVIAASGPRMAPAPASPQIIDNTTYYDANSLLMFVSNTGSFSYDRTGSLGKNDGLYYPKGTNNSVIFAAGIWMGAKVNGEIRAAVAEYANDYVPGPMTATGAAQADRGSFRTYKINKGDTRASSIDYAGWPFADGAPALKNSAGEDSLDAGGNRIPLIVGEQALWAVYNDADFSAHNSDPGSGSPGPMGVEVQHYVFGYARSGALGNTIFMQYKIINKGGNVLDSMYISLWADPDLGDAGDDFVGCDTTLSLGFCYNADNDDASYGDHAPAVGFDFFQGPIVPASGVTDTILVDGRPIEVAGFEELPMTSFNKYINGTDPSVREHTYNYMRGFERDGSPHINPTTGQVTTFFMSGDPVTQTGELDNNASDRRYMMTSGPFTMNPGDTQVVVAAVVVGQGESNISSIERLRDNDRIAQAAFDASFDIPGPPPQPTVWTVPQDNAIQVLWGLEADGDVQFGEGPPDSTGEVDTLQAFVFEGFNVYQGASSSGPWTKIATFDLANGVERIYSDIDNPNGKERVVVQRGTDSGLEHDLLVTQDAIRGVGLVNYRPYYFAVTAYNYDELNVNEFTDALGNVFGIISESFENLPSAPQEGTTPLSMTGVLADTAEIVESSSDGTVLVDYFDQNAITGDTYQVTFNADLTWNLISTTRDTVLLANQPLGIGEHAVDGMVLRVLGPKLGVKSVREVANGSGQVDPPDNVHRSRNSTSEWYMDPLGDQTLNRYSWQGATNHDYEIRWTENADNYCWDFFGQGDYSFVNPKQVPIEVWDVTDNYQLTFMLLDDDTDSTYSWGDGIYYWDIHYDDVNWQSAGAHTGQYDPDFAGLHYGRFRFFKLDDATPEPTRPAPGTVVRITTNKPSVPGVVFEFTSKKPGDGDGSVIANAVDNIYAVPNPYYNVSSLELDQFRRQIKFVNLPPVRTTIRIFNLAGDLVRTLVKDDPASTLFVWDVLTETGLPVASGMYIWHVDADGIGAKIGKLAVFTEVEQLNTY